MPATPALARAAIGRAARKAQRTGDPSDVAHVDRLRAEYRESLLAEHIALVLEGAPPLSVEQRDRLAAMLRPTSGDA